MYLLKSFCNAENRIFTYFNIVKGASALLFINDHVILMRYVTYANGLFLDSNISNRQNIDDMWQQLLFDSIYDVSVLKYDIILYIESRALK